MEAIKLEDLPHYTYEDYKHWEGKWEIINGIAYAMSPMAIPKHQRITNKIAFEFELKLKNCKRCKAFMPLDWVIRDDLIVQPDNLIICDMDLEAKNLTKTPELIVEILSPSTAKKDKITKYRIYESLKVKYYIIIDPESLQAEIYELIDDKYKLKDKFKKEGIAQIELNPDNKTKCNFEIDFKEVFEL
jgi:Uma2 family endonuclease